MRKLEERTSKVVLIKRCKVCGTNNPATIFALVNETPYCFPCLIATFPEIKRQMERWFELLAQSKAGAHNTP